MLSLPGTGRHTQLWPLTWLQLPANHSTLPMQGPLSHGVASAGRLFPQPSRGRLLMWLVMHTTERVRTPAPHSAEHYKTEDGHSRGEASPPRFWATFKWFQNTVFPHQLFALEMSDYFSRTACSVMGHQYGISPAFDFFVVIDMLTLVRLSVLALDFKNIFSRRRTRAWKRGHTSTYW